MALTSRLRGLPNLAAIRASCGSVYPPPAGHSASTGTADVRACHEVASDQGPQASAAFLTRAAPVIPRNASAQSPVRMRPGMGQGRSASVTPLFSPRPSVCRRERRDDDELLPAGYRPSSEMSPSMFVALIREVVVG